MSLYPSLEALKIDEFVQVSVNGDGDDGPESACPPLCCAFRRVSLLSPSSVGPLDRPEFVPHTVLCSAPDRRHCRCPQCRRATPSLIRSDSVSDPEASRPTEWRRAAVHGDLSAPSVGRGPRGAELEVPDPERLHGPGTEHSGAEHRRHRSPSSSKCCGASHERRPQGESDVRFALRSRFYSREIRIAIHDPVLNR